MQKDDVSEIIWKWGDRETKVFFYEQTSPQRHYHLFHELVIVLAGSGSHLIGGEEYEISRGDAFLIPPGVPHGYPTAKRLGLLNLLFFPEKLSIPLLDLVELPGYQMFFHREPALRVRHRLEHHLLLPNDAVGEIVRHAETVEAMQRQNRPGNRFYGCLALMRIFWLISTLSAEQSRDRKLPAMVRVIEHLDAHKTEPIRVTELAKLAGMSLRSFQRNFPANTGYSPVEYLIRLRLRQAAGLLATSKLDIRRIAADCGFPDGNHFTRQFKKMYGMTPRDYRGAGS